MRVTQKQIKNYLTLLEELCREEKKMYNIEQVLVDIENLNNQIKGLERLLLEKKEIVKKYLDENNLTNISNENVTAYYQERTKVNYNMQKIKELLSPEVQKAIINNTYTLNSFDDFKALCKKYSVPASEAKNIFNVKKEVDKEKLSDMYDSGLIDLKTISSFTTVDSKKSLCLRFNNEQEVLPIK